MTIELIPSRDAREYAEERGWEFGDLEKAALVHAQELPYAREREALTELKAEIADRGVRDQIDAYIGRQDELLRLFGENGGEAVYALAARGEEHSMTYFAGLEAAVAAGMRGGLAFEVSKFRLADRCTPAPAGMINPHLMPPEAGFEDLVECAGPDDMDWPVAWAAFGPGGEMERFGSSELPPETRADVERAFDPELFENAFVELPNPFERGDIVRTVGPCGQEGLVGVVETGRGKWDEMTALLEGLGYADFGDAALVVTFLVDGKLSHYHVPPVFLERFDPPEDATEHELLLCAADLVAGNGGLDWFLMALAAYRKDVQGGSGGPVTDHADEDGKAA